MAQTGASEGVGESPSVLSPIPETEDNVSEDVYTSPRTDVPSPIGEPTHVDVPSRSLSPEPVPHIERSAEDIQSPVPESPPEAKLGDSDNKEGAGDLG